jgi:flagellar basal-body rod modification protein FlgD
MSMFGALGNVGVLYAGKATFVYYLDYNAPQVDILISDDQGRIVYRETGMKFAGRNEVIWNGKNNVGQIMPDGTYRITVKARDEEGHDIASKTYTTGRLTPAAHGGSAGLSFGKIIVPLDRVLALREPMNR